MPKIYPPTNQLNLATCICNPECNDKLVIGHRGAGTLSSFAPENTLPSLLLAWKMGADIVEIDVRDTVDGVPILMHDSSLYRTTNGRGLVANLTLKEIKTLKIITHKHFKSLPQIPTLKETLHSLRNKLIICIDIKSSDIFHLVEIIKEEQMLHAVFLLIDNIEEGIKARNSHVSITLVPKIKTIADIDRYLKHLSPICAVEIKYQDATPEIVKYVHSKGIKILMDALGPWEFIDPMRYKKILNCGADIIQTDRLHRLVPLIKSKQTQL